MRTTDLTIDYAQDNQPWTLPYSNRVQSSDVPHILGSHAVLHATKSLGKIAAVFEALDHSEEAVISAGQIQVISDMSADLFTIALRFANLYGFNLAHSLVKRVEEKNGVSLLTPQRDIRS